MREAHKRLMRRHIAHYVRFKSTACSKIYARLAVLRNTPHFDIARALLV